MRGGDEDNNDDDHNNDDGHRTNDGDSTIHPRSLLIAHTLVAENDKQFDRETVGCASALNWVSFILLLFAAISSYWTWGTGLTQGNVGVTSTLGPWTAGETWSASAVPCNCNINGWCYSWCWLSTRPVSWSDLNPSNACNLGSSVYMYWSGPLGYCSFPDGFVPPTNDNSTDQQGNATGYERSTPAPPGTTFNVPSQVPATQALIILATIFVFFASVLGCMDGASDRGDRRKGVAVSTVVCAFLAFIFCLAAYCTWAGFPYVMEINAGRVAMPVWVDINTQDLRVINVVGATYGPGWSTALSASIITFFAMVMQCATIGSANQKRAASFAPAPPQPIVQEAVLVPPPAIGNEGKEVAAV
ncbi:hypothetical protein BASA81_005171 [Batrachochytrium salamandrivorans]|nr:hypothetical protein BASA81_005171 [Batrachochytrium salamandrivorans]